MLPQNAYIHIDRIHVSGPCTHKPIGRVIYGYDEQVGLVALGARTQTTGADVAIIQSKKVQDKDVANVLEIHCCPPKVLQKHNVFGHSSILDYIYQVFDLLTRKHGIEVDPLEREEWRSGCVWLTEVHLTGNCGCPSRYIVPIIDAVGENNPVGSLRPLLTSITLGYSGKRRSTCDMLTLYGKRVELESVWKHPGQYQSKLIDFATDSIRAEVKLYSQGLKARKLQYGANWRDVNVADLFFKILDTYKVNYAIQPLLTEDELAVLTKGELKAYKLWLAGEDINDLYCRTTAWKLAKSIKEKTGMVVSGKRRPEALPEIHLAEIFRPENVLPIPDWAFGTPYYFPPTQPDVPRKRGSGIGDAPLVNGQVDQVTYVDGKLLVI